MDVCVAGLPGGVRTGRRHVLACWPQETELQDIVVEEDLQVGLWLCDLPVAQVTRCTGRKQQPSAVSTSKVVDRRLVLGPRHIEVDEVLLS